MKTICSAVLNIINNDIRVIRTNKAFISHKYKVYLIELTASIANDSCDKINGINIIRMQYHSKISIRNNSFNELAVYNFKQNIINRFFILRFFRKLLWKIKINLFIFRSLISIKYDILYCNDFNTLISGYLASRRKKAKLIYDSHELWFEQGYSINSFTLKIVNLFEKFLESVLISRCDAVITVSEGISNELVKRYGIKKPLVIRNLDEEKPLPSFKERMKIRSKLNIPNNCILIVYQGSLHENRGIPELIEAVGHLPNNIHLLLMGKNISSEDLKSIKNNNRIHFPGMIPQKDLFNYTACADIGIAPIRIKGLLSHELTFPNKFSQYMNAGLTLALYDIQSSREIIEKYDCGVVFEPGSFQNIVKVINDIISSGKLEYYKGNSRKGFLKEYNWKIEKHKLIDIIKQL